MIDFDRDELARQLDSVGKDGNTINYVLDIAEKFPDNIATPEELYDFGRRLNQYNTWDYIAEDLADSSGVETPNENYKDWKDYLEKLTIYPDDSFEVWVDDNNPDYIALLDS